MLPSNLINVWKRKGNIQPRYPTPTPINLLVADKLINAYRNGVGKKKAVIKSVAETLEDEGHNFRLVRGLSLLLDRQSTFKCTSQIDPPQLRKTIFEMAGTNPATTLEKHRTLIQEVAHKLGISSEQIEESMYADLDSELVLQSFEPLSPETLLKEYNLSLTQTLLFDSTELRFTVTANWQKIFYKAKRLGLIYEAYRNNETWIKIDGPASLFKLNRRYGTAIAKLLPAIVASPKWIIEAKILWKLTNEVCTLKLESSKHETLFETALARSAADTFDSTVEEDFANRFQALNTGWKLRREPEPIIAGQHVLIPDFSFEREGTKLYMEIVGYWTPEYLQRKIEKLKKTKERIIVATDENLACERLTRLENQQTLDMIYYKGIIPLPPILRILQEAAKESNVKQTEFLKTLDAKFTQPVIKFEEFAAQTGTSVEAVQAALTEKTPLDYAVLSDCLIRKDILQRIKEELDHQIAKTGKLLLTEAAKITQKTQADLTSTIQTLGYKIIWHGIDPEKAEVTKP